MVKAHESVRIQAFGPEPSVEALDIRVVGRLSWFGEVERDALLVSPQVKITRDELRTLIDWSLDIHACSTGAQVSEPHPRRGN